MLMVGILARPNALQGLAATHYSCAESMYTWLRYQISRFCEKFTPRPAIYKKIAHSFALIHCGASAVRRESGKFWCGRKTRKMGLSESRRSKHRDTRALARDFCWHCSAVSDVRFYCVRRERAPSAQALAACST